MGRRAWSVWLGMAAAGGCLLLGGSAPSADAEARLAALQAEEARMDAALDSVETRLLGGQARVHLWEELARRHQHVSAVQCQYADANLVEMARHFEQQEEKARQLRKRRRMAAVDASMLTSANKGQLRR